ncbi:sugar transferase [Arthrobacter sp. 92]|uniref:sugar transferase n=1 Tax=Arthrobacter sp. 92 TaxID=3418175 RepID=UPI003D072041
MPADRQWRRRYAGRLAVLDGFVVCWAVAGAYFVRFGPREVSVPRSEETAYAVLAAILAGAWWLMLGAWGSRAPNVLGSGADEYKRLLTVSMWLFASVAIVSYSLRIDTARGFVGLALPAGVLGLLAARWLVRQHLALERKQGRSSSRLLIIGSPESTAHLVRSLRSAPAAGYIPVLVYLPGASVEELHLSRVSVPVAGIQSDFESILAAILSSEVDTVAISAGAELPPTDLRRMGWELAARDIGMILAPALTDIAGPRIHTQPVAGLPLIHVSTPKLTGGKKLAKRTFDVATAGTLLLALAPVFLIVSILIKTTSPGPLFYSQERVGLRGRVFRMRKFRSMKRNADEELARLLEAQGSIDKPLFKIHNDPRITGVGQILRKFSLDELPQLFNVLGGSMSLVGPRPQRDAEVALYDDAAHRRLYVSPGMSGLWQVSGRSNLSWEESIRLDLYYVENWSLMGDLVILFKTFKAVFSGTGAV